MLIGVGGGGGLGGVSIRCHTQRFIFLLSLCIYESVSNERGIDR